MHRLIILLTVCVLSLTALAPSALSAKKQTFDELCHDILAALQEFYPVTATEMGIHGYDFLLADYSKKSARAMIRKLTDFEKKLRRVNQSSLSEHERINYRLIKSNVDIALLNLREIKWHLRSPQLYVDEAINGVYFLMLSQHAPLFEKRPAIMARMKAVPSLFKTARARVKKPPQVWIDAAQESLESGSQFFKEVAAQLSSEFPEQADEIQKVSTAAREAMNDFGVWLSEVQPGAPESFAIGKTAYDYKLSHEYMLDFDSDSLLALGENLLSEAQAAYRDYEAFVENNHQNGTPDVFVPASFSAEDILDYYNWETEQQRLWCDESGFVTVPDEVADVSVIETPAFLRSMIAGIAYQPAGPFDSVQHGYFYVRPVPRDMEPPVLEARYKYVYRRGFKGSVVHEAYPGHHLQTQLAGLNPDPVRKWQMNLMLIEGWALYCEEMVYHHGLYGEEDHTQWLGTLGGIRFRAARIVADVKLQTGQFSYEECVDWMIQELGVESESGREYIRKNVRSYTLKPTMPMTYLTGKTEILALRAAAEARDGASFDQRAFHDGLLAEGSIPVALMWEIMGLQK